MQDRRAVARGTPDRRRKPWVGVRQRRLAPWTGPRERRTAPRSDVLREGEVHVEALDLRAATVQRREWAALAARAAEPNPFYEPEFALPAAQRLTTARRPLFLAARKRVDGRIRMIGLLPIAPDLQRFGFEPVRGWRHPLTALGAPLLDRDFAVEAFAALLDWIAAFRPRAGGLLVWSVPTSGPAAQAMRHVAVERGLGRRELETSERAALFAGADPLKIVSKAKRRQLGRLRRRLAEKGALTFHMATGEAVDQAMERFLEIEAAGWKGERGTALLQDPFALAVARAFMRGLARQSRCFVASLHLDGAPIAASAVVASGDLAVYWKTAYDERYAHYSPGAQLSLDLTGALLAAPGIAKTDSAALPGNVMIETLWRERLRVADILVGGDGQGLRFSLTTRYEIMRRSLRSGAKRVYYGLTGRKRS